MNTVLLDSFLAVVQEGNVTRAAHTLSLAQSTVSAHLRMLEREVGHALFDRVGRTVEVNATGERVAVVARRILRERAELRRVAEPEQFPRGIVTVGAPETTCAYLLPTAIENLRADASDVTLHLVPSFGRRLVEELDHGTVDLAISLDPPGDDPWSSGPFEVSSLGSERLCVVRAPDVDDEEVDTLLVTGEGCSYRDLSLRLARAGNFAVHRRMEFGSIEALKACARARLGIAVLPWSAVREDVEAGRLTETVVPGTPRSFAMTLARHRERTMTPAVRAVARAVAAAVPAE